jgi:predicted nucleic acid-binding Zn ribbon protein
MSLGQPQHIGNVLAQLMARRGYARVRSANALAEAWRQVAGEQLAANTRATCVRRGVLEILVGNSTLAQEIGFKKQALIRQLAELLSDEKIRDLKCRVGPVN